MMARNVIFKGRNVISQLCARSMSSTPLVDIKVNEKNGIATVSMQKAPVNALNLEMLQALLDAFDEVSSNRYKGMVLTSNLPTIYSGGLDIMEMYKPDPARLKDFWSTLQEVWLRLYGSPFPSAAAINGHAPAGGCLLAMCCEHRVMVNGKFNIGLNETALGIVAPSWFQDTMVNTISPRIAEKAITQGKMFSVDEALKIGMIDELATDKEDAIAKCEAFIESFAKINHQARALSKMVFRRKPIQDLENNREQDVAMFETTVQNPKVQKSLEAYITALKNKSK